MGQNINEKSSARRFKAFVSPTGTTQIHLRNPYTVAWWSIAFPGLGHLLLSKYLRGYLLFIWEICINYKAHINLAILYSLTGNFNLAKEVIDKRWVFLYLPTYFFAIWDSYRTTVDLNNNYILASQEGKDIKIYSANALEINYLDRRIPWLAFLWSAFSPGVGHLYVSRLPFAFFILTWWIIIVTHSNILLAIYYTFIGEFSAAKSIIDYQWFLNVPSICLFTMYDSYIKTVENNKLFEWEQDIYFKKEYEPKSFNLPINKKELRGNEMYIFSIFEHSIALEKAIATMEMKGIAKDSILVLPMNKRNKEEALFDSIHKSDGISLLDLPMILATLFSIFGSIYGFILSMGPIIWGLIGAFTGFSIGLIIKLYSTKKHLHWQSFKKEPEVIVVIRCKDTELEIVKDILWKNDAIGVRDFK